VEESTLFQPNVYKGRLNPGEHRLDSSQIDIADSASVIGTVDQQLDQPIIFQDGHASFPLAPIDQDFTLQMRPSAAAG